MRGVAGASGDKSNPGSVGLYIGELFQNGMEAVAAKDIERLQAGRIKYGESWRKRGGWEAFANLTRKWDRIETAAEACKWDIFDAIKAHTAHDGTIDGKDSLLDDIGDLRRYLMLVEEYVTRPDKAFSLHGEAEEWMKEDDRRRKRRR